MLTTVLLATIALAQTPGSADAAPDEPPPAQDELGAWGPTGWILGVDYAPPSTRADMAWTEAEQLSGTLVGENDGLLRSPLSLYGGRGIGQNAFVGGLSYARLARVDWSADGRFKTSASGVRVAFDWQRYLLPRELMRPTVWVGLGAYGVIPIAEDRSSTDTDTEREDRAEAAAAVRARVGGYGGRAGLGADLRLTEQVSLGFRSHVGLYRAQVIQEDTLISSSLWSTEAAIRVQFEL